MRGCVAAKRDMEFEYWWLLALPPLCAVWVNAHGGVVAGLGVLALYWTAEDPGRGSRAAAVLALVGAINIPIIKYSVDWWYTLHQPATFTITGRAAMPMEMWAPLLKGTATILLFFVTMDKPLKVARFAWVPEINLTSVQLQPNRFLIRSAAEFSIFVMYFCP